MRWDDLFADLEAAADALAQAERAGEVDDRTRAEVGGLHVVDRLRGALGVPVRLRLLGGVSVAGSLVRVGADFILLDEDAGREAVLPTAAIVTVRGLPRFAATPGSAGIVASRLGLRQALRGVARDRSATRLHLRDGSTVDATIDRVGADFIEVATHPGAEQRRRQDVREVELIPLAAIVAVRRGA